MTKLIHKQTTKPSKETVHKIDTNFPFTILPKERKTLQFSNLAIEVIKAKYDIFCIAFDGKPIKK